MYETQQIILCRIDGACPLMDDIPGLCGGKCPWGGDNSVTTKDVVVTANQAKEEAKYESQQTTIITAEDIAQKQAKSVEDIIFSETGMSRNVDAMGRVTVSIRGAEPRHTLILVDGQPVMGDFAKYSGQADELQRLGTENVERIEIIQGAASAKYGSDAIGGVINVITKKASKDAGLQVNVEGRRAKGDSDIFPYQNFFLRADSGQIGKFRAAVYGSKRDIMPIYDNDGMTLLPESIMTGDIGDYKNSLRYYGTTSDIGISTEYDVNDNNTLSFHIDRYKEDLHKDTKHTNMIFEPYQNFKRTATRDTYGLAWKGNNNGNTDWNVEFNYARINENDIALTSDYQKSIYEGKNTLNYLDDLEHKQYDFKASANTQVNDKHLLTYGVSYTYETGEGSRLKNAPDTHQRTIDPWDYDKSLAVDETTGEPSSTIHDWQYGKDENGNITWKSDYEYYGYDSNDASTQKPAFTYDEFLKFTTGSIFSTYSNIAKDPEALARYNEFEAQIKNDPANASNLYVLFFGNAGIRYYNDPSKYDVKFNGKTFQEIYNSLNNVQTVGRASIRKQSFFLQDTWQVNDNTILSPIVRLDHSDLFGSEVTFNVGLTHNLGGHANRRFKANIGTGYSEPGMGELYYNWEMYSGSPVGMGTGRLGWYWIGNRDLEPEKSVNMDIAVEGENKNTYARAGLFYNRIRNYMTTYFTGAMIDFHPEYNETNNLGAWKFLNPPDMVYSFKNIGRAEITGFEASVEQKFGSRWKGKLGYTWLHAINKSDSDMPRQLLDKPQHKVDIGISYDNPKSGWSGSLWGDYYINMLDSNSVAGNGNYMSSGQDSSGNTVITYNFAEGGKQTYQKKTFGIWNIIVQKKLDKDSLVYFGIDNLFNHHDYDRALQERVYKVGLNMKFGADGKLKADVPTVEKAKEMSREKLSGRESADWFIKAPFDTAKEQGVEVIGDYRARWNVFGGSDKPDATVTASSSVGDAAKNMLDKAGHGFEQRLRLGLDARISENTNVTILGSASGMSGVDTIHDVSDSKGLNHQRVENIDVTQHANKWDFSVGRLTEPMGVTGYWFGKEYDGGRAVWTSGKNQVRIGYGDFSHSTGITDSAYTHATRQTFYRAPTAIEFLGYNGIGGISVESKNGTVDNADKNINFYQQIRAAKTEAEQATILKRMWTLIKDAYGTEFTEDTLFNSTNLSFYHYNVKLPAIQYTYIDKDGNKMDDRTASTSVYLNYTTDADILDAPSEKAWLETYLSNEDHLADVADAVQQKWQTQYNSLLNQGYTGIEITGGTPTNWKEYVTSLMDNYQESSSYFVAWSNGDGTYEDMTTSSRISNWLEQLGFFLYRKDDYSTLPREKLGNVTGAVIKVTGTVLQKDTIPSIDRAAFVQYKHQMGDHFGVQAWYLRSVNDDTHSLAYAHGDSNDVYSYDRLANIIGLGAAWHISDNLRFSFDWGQNRTDFGRMMNGSTIYSHESGTSDFDIEGHSKGGTPRFWVARVDVGHADMDKPGSWNAFADYKYFQHGSFFGGNGTEALPDRYLDGIKSFTIGGGYVPAKDFLIEAFYTFDAKGIGKRDTLYGSENFTLGDYTRIQATFRF